MSKKLGNLIKEARTAKGLTQAELAAMVDGISATDISKTERGEKEPAEGQVRAIAKALGVTQTSLVSVMSKSAKTASSKSSSAGKTAAGKTSSVKTGAGKNDVGGTTLKLTQTEKKLVELYRKADADTKKAVMSFLKGEATSTEDIIGSVIGSAINLLTKKS